MIPKSGVPVFGQRSCARGGGAPKDASSHGHALRRHGSAPSSFPPPPAGEGREGARSPSGAPQRHLTRRANARTQPRPRFTRTKRDTQALPAPSFALKRSTPHPDRSAGGDDARTARERGNKSRPQEPHSLRVQVCLEHRNRIRDESQGKRDRRVIECASWPEQVRP